MMIYDVGMLVVSSQPKAAFCDFTSDCKSGIGLRNFSSVVLMQLRGFAGHPVLFAACISKRK